MRTSDLTALALAAFLAGGSTAALALDTKRVPTGPAPAAPFDSAAAALRSGVRDYYAGNKADAAQALEYAATKGHTLALWKLGRMYADGDGVPQDDLKAFEFFSKIADNHADESPDSPNAGAVSSAFVALGSYFLDGIKGTYVKQDAKRALEMFSYAASYFGNSDAQYNLARLYLDGTGVVKDARQAARWFNLAAEKGHHEAQALLGSLLLTGSGGVPRQRARGLMWLTVARDSADPVKDRWITDLHDKAFASASESERQAALAFLEQYLRRSR